MQTAEIAGTHSTFRAVTLAREYGSGGGVIAKRVAEHLGWTLLDERVILAVARETGVDVDTVRRRDERVDSWWRRLQSAGLWATAIHAGVRPDHAQFFDADTIAEFTHEVIRSAAAKGKCVIVGRGAQCVLRSLPRVLRVFVSASWSARIVQAQRRAQSRDDVAATLRASDRMRAAYLRRHFGRDWSDPGLYHMMMDSQLGVETAAALIARAATGAEVAPITNDRRHAAWLVATNASRRSV